MIVIVLYTFLWWAISYLPVCGGGRMLLATNAITGIMEADVNVKKSNVIIVINYRPRIINAPHMQQFITFVKN